MLQVIVVDELYPVYYLVEPSSISKKKIELSEEFVARYKEVLRDFEEIQKELDRLYNE